MKSLRFLFPAAAAFALLAAATPAHAQTATAVFDGCVLDAGTVRGTLSLTVKVVEKAGTTTWTFTGKALLQNATLSFSHKAVNLPPTGNIEIAAKNGETLKLSYAPLLVSGTLAGGSVTGTLNVLLYQNAFANKNNEEAQQLLGNLRGVYNVALVDVARFQGYLTLTVGNLGAVKIAGRLADGTAVSGSSKLVPIPGGCIVPFHRPLYTKRGYASGLFIVNTATQDVQNFPAISARWESADPKKGIFNHTLDSMGGRFSDGRVGPVIEPGLKFTAYPLGVLPAPAAGLTGKWLDFFPDRIALQHAVGKISLPKGTAPKKVDGFFKYTGDNPCVATLLYTARTGLFKGSFKIYYATAGDMATGVTQHRVVSVPYTGVMIKRGGNIFGLGTGTTTLNKEKHSFAVQLLP